MNYQPLFDMHVLLSDEFIAALRFSFVFFLIFFIFIILAAVAYSAFLFLGGRNA